MLQIKRLYLFVSMLLLLASCSEEPQRKNFSKDTLRDNRVTLASKAKEQTDASHFLKRQIIDSVLPTLASVSSAMHYDEKEKHYSLCYTRIGKKEIAIFSIGDSEVFAITKVADKWAETDSIRISDHFMSFEVKDMNGDGKVDILINGQPNMDGNARSYIFLTDKDTTMDYIPCDHLWNATFDHASGLLRSCCAGGKHGNDKAVYKWHHELLIPIRGVKMDVNMETKRRDSLYNIKFYTIQQDVITVYKEVYSANSSAWDTCLFKDYGR